MPRLLVKLENFAYIVASLDYLQTIELLKPRFVKKKF